MICLFFYNILMQHLDNNTFEIVLSYLNHKDWFTLSISSSSLNNNINNIFHSKLKTISPLKNWIILQDYFILQNLLKCAPYCSTCSFPCFHCEKTCRYCSTSNHYHCWHESGSEYYICPHCINKIICNNKNLDHCKVCILHCKICKLCYCEDCVPGTELEEFDYDDFLCQKCENII